jgi:hypothetical protein
MLSRPLAVRRREIVVPLCPSELIPLGVLTFFPPHTHFSVL